MLKRLKEYWGSLKHGRPGSRFEEQYEKEHRKKKSPVGRALRIAAGAILMPIGLFFLAVPGPGLLIIGLGAVLIAREFRFAAGVLDWIEVRGRQVHKWAKQRWQRLVRARRAISR
jgi:uncharacterized protein (TIGR02611 family)